MPSKLDSAGAAAFAFLNEHFLSDTTPPSPSPQASPVAKLSSFAAPLALSSISTETVLSASFIISAGPSHLLPVITAATVFTTRPVSTVTAVLAGILTHASLALVPDISLLVSFDIPTAATASSLPTFSMVSSSAPVISAYPSGFSAPTAVRQSSSKSVIVNHQSSAPESVAFSTHSRVPVIAVLRERLARRDAEFAELDEALIAGKSRVLELELSLSADASKAAMLRSQVVILRAKISAARAALFTASFSAVLETSAPSTMRTDNELFESRVCELSSTVDDIRLQLAVAQSFISSAALSCFVASTSDMWVVYAL